MRSLLCLITFGILTTNCGIQSQPTSAESPNIVFIFIDDMGYGDLSSYGNTSVETPNIDQLAEEGIRFEQFYVNSPICSPSRVAVTTGQYPLRWNITSFLGTRKRNNNRGMDHYLDTQAPSLARILKDAGYYTAHVGKWHMGGQRDIEGAPRISEYGFDNSLTSFEGLGERLGWVFETREWNGSNKFHLSVQQEKLGNGEVHWKKRYREAELFVDQALEEIQTASDKNQPFYINLWTDAVHTPLEARPDLRGDGSIQANYFGVIQDLDKQLGRIFNRIQNNPTLSENTLIVLSSDNGPSRKVGSAGGLRGHKGNLYEGGIREPFIVWGPGIIEKSGRGSVNKNTVLAGMDLPPSLLAIVGVEIPEFIQFDGMDMSKPMLGKSSDKRDKPIMWVRPPGVNGPNHEWPDLAIRDGKWKLLVNIDGSGAELYDIDTDPGEQNNKVDHHSEVAKRLKDNVLAWFKGIISNTTDSTDPWK